MVLGLKASSVIVCAAAPPQIGFWTEGINRGVSPIVP